MANFKLFTQNVNSLILLFLKGFPDNVDRQFLKFQMTILFALEENIL